MFDILIKLLKKHNKCTHKNALLHSEQGYCPDCGQYLVKSYYLLRCSCCGVKREAKVVFGEILPKDNFCTNCGCEDYYIEKIDKINFIDANYAIYLKEPVFNENKNLNYSTFVWSENANKIAMDNVEDKIYEELKKVIKK